MAKITIENLHHNRNYYRIIQGHITYEALKLEEALDLAEKLLTDFSDNIKLFEVHVKNDRQPALRQKYGWCIKGDSEEEVFRKFDCEIIKVIALTDDMPVRRYMITYNFDSYGSHDTELRSEVQCGRTPSEALYWFKEYFPSPLGVYEIVKVEDIDL